MLKNARKMMIGALVGLVGLAAPATAFAYEAPAAYIIDEVEEAPARPTAYRTTANLRLRTGPSLYDSIIRTISWGTAVTVVDFRDGEWFAVNVNGTYGYMYAEFLTPATTSEPARTVQVVNGVELLDWSYVRHNIVQNGMPMQVTDVRTGIVYWVSAFSQGRHADVETLTQHDTDEMRRAFGGRWTWTPRPIWVTIGDRTFAASINGMPHAGSTISGNGMSGHVCMHFLGSTTHNGTRSHERDHQAAIQEAIRAAQ